MPWNECHVMDERVRLISRLLDGEPMARLCAEFGISRKTGYKNYHRYKWRGIEGLTDRAPQITVPAKTLPLDPRVIGEWAIEGYPTSPLPGGTGGT